MDIENFAEYISLGWHLVSLESSAHITRPFWLLESPPEKLGIILIGLFLCYFFSLEALHILSLSHSVSIIIWKRDFRFWSNHLVFCMLLVTL